MNQGGSLTYDERHGEMMSIATKQQAENMRGGNVKTDVIAFEAVTLGEDVFHAGIIFTSVLKGQLNIDWDSVSHMTIETQLTTLQLEKDRATYLSRAEIYIEREA